jgi:YHYH protein
MMLKPYKISFFCITLALVLTACGGGGSSSSTSPGGTSSTTPTILGVLPGDQRISVAFNFIGGKVAALASLSTYASSYTATCISSDGGTIGAATANNPIAVTGLTNGKTYTCTVAAKSDTGTTQSTSTASTATIPNAGPFTSATALSATANSTHLTAYPTYASYCNYTNQTATGAGFVPTITYTNAAGAATTGTSQSTINCTGTTSRTITSNALPDHISSIFFSNGLSGFTSSPYFSGNPNLIGAKSVSKTLPYSGTISTSYVTGTFGYNNTACYAKLASGDTLATGCTLVSYAYLNNGVKVEPGTAETYVATRTYNVEGKNYYQDIGLDPSNAHNQPTRSGGSDAFYGYYHYHGIPEGHVSRLGKGNTTMTLIGFASDGFPIYARYGFTNRSSTTGGLSVMKANYRVRTAAELTAAGYTDRPSASVAPYGTFVQDWVFDPTGVNGDLDACNGRFGVTPESPTTAIYHYFMTDTYPYIGRCVWGSSPASWGYTASEN